MDSPQFDRPAAADHALTDHVLTDHGRRAGLPERPRILPGLPVLMRGPDCLQVGIDPDHAVVIAGLPPPLAELVRHLDGRRTVADLTAHVAEQVDPAALTEVLAALMAAGVLDDAAGSVGQSALPRLAPDATTVSLRAGGTGPAALTTRDAAAVVVYGNGRLAVAAAALLAAAGIGWVHVAAEGVVQPEDIGSGYLAADVGRPRVRAAQEALRRTEVEIRTGRLPPQRTPELVLLADVLVPDPVLVTTLMAMKVPHLLAGVRPGVGMVGPLVLPGRSSCLRCADLYRTDRDPCWPRLAAQLAGRTQPADLVTVHATAAFAAGQILLALDCSRVGAEPPATWNASLELDPIRGVLGRRPRDPHPACTCGPARRQEDKEVSP